MSLEVTYQFHTKDNLHKIDLIGDLDADTCHKLDRVTNNIEKPQGNVIIQCDSLLFIDRLGLEALIRLFNLIDKENYAFTLMDIENNLHRLLKIIGLDKHKSLKIYPK